MKKVHIEQNFETLPYEYITSKLNEYTLFMKEYNNSNKYRLIFSFNPICSNVLFNTITEITEKEGSDDCKCYNFLQDNIVVENATNLYEYLKYTKRINPSNSTNFLNKTKLIMDTSYSHPSIGGFNYHCGYDIFDNHILRSKDFVVVNKINENIRTEEQRKYFNTLADYLRDSNGDIKHDEKLNNPNFSFNEPKINKHLYTTDSLMSFNISVNENLIENDGWFGFENKGYLNIKNYKDIVLNRVINNSDIGKFVDMYPDRTLYSIVPKYNEYRNRYENNWEFCLTYPHENIYDNKLVTEHGYNGIECILKLDGTLQIGVFPSSKIITIRTFIEHGLKINDKIKLAYFWEDDNGNLISSGETTNTCTVIDVDGNAYEKKQYFKIRVNDISNLITDIYAKIEGKDENENIDTFAVERDYFVDNNVKFRFCRVAGGKRCKYYLRKFKKLNKINGDSYTYTLNKLGFAKNIYNDRIGEVIFDDIIDVSGIKNNLGLPLHEIFISVFKTNYGHKKWYDDCDVSHESIEFSHCFGELSSGLDLPSDKECVDYNVHKIHNINLNTTDSDRMGIHKSGRALEKDIIITNESFYGDLVEFNENGLEEKVLEDVFFRFNTRQRETRKDVFSALTYHEIIHDDYDLSEAEGFFEEMNLSFGNDGKGSDVPINLNPEGYFYKAHYRLPLKEYMPRTYWGSDTRVNVIACNKSEKHRIGAPKRYTYYYEIICDKVYYMTTHDSIYFINKTDFNDIIYGVITKSDKNTYNLSINKNIDANDLMEDYVLFKVNPLKPQNAYNLYDGTGRYVWREFKNFTDIDSESELYNRPFTNETHYLHKDINLYLKRQDPSGVYGLSFNSDMPLFKTNLVILGNEKDVNNNDYVKNIEPGQC